MGVVTDFLPPGRSKGTDWMCSFSIMDSSFDCYNQPYVEGLKIRFFRPTENEMPSIRGTGDVILIRFLKIKQWSGLTMGISNRGTSWTVFPVGSIPAEVSGSQIQLKHIKEPRAQVPSVSEMRYAVGLCHSRDGIMPTQPTSTPMQSSSATFPIGSAPSNLVRKDKYALIKDIASDTYYDLVGQVVRTYPHSDRIELYFTDYTSNSLLFNYEWGQDDEDCSGREGDIYGYVPRVSTNKKWPGPYGRMTMTVTLWPPHAHFVRDNVKDNDYVYLRNVHIKFSKDCKLEGVLHTDQRCPDRINVTAVNNNSDDDRVKDVLRRKRDYSKKFQKSTKEFVAEVRGSKRKNLDEVKPLSRTAQRKKRKQEREQLAKAKYRDDGGSDKENPVGMSTKDQPSDNKSVLSCQKQDLNRNGMSNELPSFMTICYIVSIVTILSTYGHRLKNTRHPVRSAIDKLQIG